ncbi:hypothetical protein [Phenylobacterium sp.]|uniref:hypothetical protein n=1 Tax=Phenylobacterium sp. TaxID=1871053 RepID=UPI0027303455|nr:hypothetical protein [Phenylobacterium sp.]MDP1616293.1 hypothetical protein [Phenylobacterium sp.]MDP1987367.1 hypothetical protein [Phenylobacterium sp.]
MADAFRIPIGAALACEAARASLKPRSLGPADPYRFRSCSMVAIFTILVFLVVVGAINFYEFGRLD